MSMKKTIDKKTKTLIMKAYAAGFSFGQECEFKGLRNEYANMQTTRKKYMDTKFTLEA